MSYPELKAGEAKALSSSSTEEVGIGGFTFFARVSDSTTYTTQAPTSVVEDGSYIGDHLVNDPLRITIAGDVADIFIIAQAQSKSESRLPTVGKVVSLKPGRTATQVQKVAKIINTATEQKKKITEQLSEGRNQASVTGNTSSGKSYREQFIDYMEAIHYGKQLVEISMPFRKHDSMAITDITVTRDNQRNALSFTITAQKFRIAKTVYVSASQYFRKPAPAVKSQVAGTADKGAQSPESGNKKRKSLLTAITGR